MSRAYSSYLQAASSLALEERRADNDLPESLVRSNRIQFMHANPTANAKQLDTDLFGGSLKNHGIDYRGSLVFERLAWRIGSRCTSALHHVEQ